MATAILFAGGLIAEAIRPELFTSEHVDMLAWVIVIVIVYDIITLLKSK